MMNNIFTVSKREDKEVGPSQEELYCFDIAAIREARQNKKYVKCKKLPFLIFD